jgi:ubiquinol-cytochrome c reductase cytochrome b subunit
VPEWYFLPFYAILRSIPDKLSGVVGLLCSILVLAIVPLLETSVVRSMSFRPASKFFFWFFVLNCFVLGWVGGQPVKFPYLDISRVSMVLYFIYFLYISHILVFFDSLV